MKKKEYIKPEMKVYQIETPSILVASNDPNGFGFASDEDYKEDNLDDFMNPDGSIDAD